MREIKFRGKNNGNWVYGYLRKPSNGRCFISYEHDKLWYELEVDPRTIGQYAGLKDKNDKEWCEGDKTDIEDSCYGVVVFKEGSFCFDWYELYERGGSGYIETCKMTEYHYDSMEIAGDIYDDLEEVK